MQTPDINSLTLSYGSRGQPSGEEKRSQKLSPQNHVASECGDILSHTEDDHVIFAAIKKLFRYVFQIDENCKDTCYSVDHMAESILTFHSYLERLARCREHDIPTKLGLLLDRYLATSMKKQLLDIQLQVMKEIFGFLTEIARLSSTRPFISEDLISKTVEVFNLVRDISLTAWILRFLDRVVIGNPQAVLYSDGLIHGIIDFIQSERLRMRHEPQIACEACAECRANQFLGLSLCTAIIVHNCPALLPRHMEKIILVCCACLKDVTSLTITLEAFAVLSLIQATRDSVYERTVLEHGLVPDIVALLSHQNPLIKFNAITAVGNLLLGDEHEAREVMKSPLLSHLPALFLHDPETVQKTLWLTTNAFVDLPFLLPAIFDFHIAPYLPFWLQTTEHVKRSSWATEHAKSSSWATKHVKRALWIVENLLACNCENYTDRLLGFDRFGIVALLTRLVSNGFKGSSVNDTKTHRLAVDCIYGVIRFVRNHRHFMFDYEVIDSGHTLYRVVTALQDEGFLEVVRERADTDATAASLLEKLHTLNAEIGLEV